MAGNVLKSGSSLFLSCCSRSVGVVVTPRSNLLFNSSSSSLYFSQSQRKGKGTNGGSRLSNEPVSTISIPFINNNNNGRRTMLFCTTSTSTSNVADSSSSVVSDRTTSSTLSSGNGDLTMVKDAANTLEIRVGRILRVWKHEEADSLYVEEVDVGEPESRIICSGLVNYMPLDHLQDKKVIVLANLKPRNMRGVKSHGMLMAASDASHEIVELLVPPEGSLPGERVWFGSADEKDNLPDAATPNQIQKKKIWELVQPHLRTDDSCVAALGMHFMRTSAGLVVCRSLKNANIS